MPTKRELLSSVLFNGKRIKTPWFCDLSYIYSARQHEATVSGADNPGDYIDFHRKLGCGVYVYAPLTFMARCSPEVKHTVTPVDIYGFDETFSTPVGTVTRSCRYSNIMYTIAETKHFVESVEDLRVMQYVVLHTEYFPDYGGFNAVDEAWGGDGMAVPLFLSVSPLQRLLTRWARVEDAVCLIADETDEVEEIFGRIAEHEATVIDIIAEGPGKYIEFAENLSSDITGAGFFKRYNMPIYRNRSARLHKAGKKVGIHIDGSLRGCLELLAPSGFDVAEAVTPAPGGDVQPEDIRALAGDIIIWGGVPGVLFSSLYSDEYFENYVRRVLDIFGKDDRFIMGVADQVPPDGVISRVKFVAEIIDKYYK